MWSRRRVVAASLAAALVLAGCSETLGEGADNPQKNDEAAAIQAELAQLPGVVKVEVGWSDYITEPDETHAYLVAEPGSDFEDLADQATEAIWKSRITPINSISIDVASSDLDDVASGVTRLYVLSRDRAKLEAKFGRRPDE